MAAPWVSSARADGLNRVEVVFNEPVQGPDLLDPAQWLNGPIYTGVTPVISAVTYSGVTAVLWLASNMTPDRLYEVRAPGTITNAALEVIDPARRWADYVTPQVTELESGNPWTIAQTGEHAPLVEPPYEMVPWNAALPFTSLAQSVWISLFSDARAAADERPLDPDADPPARGGWWADTYSGETFGSRLWLLQHATGPDIAKTAKRYAEEALEWMVTEGVASRVEVVAERQGLDRLALQVLVAKTDGGVETILFPDLWSEVT